MRVLDKLNRTVPGAGAMVGRLRDVSGMVGRFGLNLRQLASLRHLPRFVRDLDRFVAIGGEVDRVSVACADYEESAGSTRGHYFHQDLFVASCIWSHNPRRHVDVGSRIDGFVAHVASFRAVEVLDVRPLGQCEHANIRFVRHDLMADAVDRVGRADSVSCLHALEHFGLGRYGDPLDPNGHVKGFNNLVNLVESGGRLYVGVPIGRRDEVHFNTHRIFHPRTLVSWGERVGTRLERFAFIDDAGRFFDGVDLQGGGVSVDYGCGVYVFRRC